MPILHKQYDAIVIGGGFFGCSLAVELRKRFSRVLLIEKESDLLQRASYVNQARVHNGYHYPRHFLTAVRSKVNFPRFVDEFSDCIVNDFEKYYAIATKYSKTTASQFRSFMERVGSPIERAPENVRSLFNQNLIEDVFSVREYAFDAVKLKMIATERLASSNVEVVFGAVATSVRKNVDILETQIRFSAGDTLWVPSSNVYNCTYSSINNLLKNSQLPLIPLKHEITEMSLIKLPPELAQKSVTVMCGPFFSFMPFPALGLTTLSHVRYTPHCHWYDDAEKYFSPLRYFDEYPRKSNFPAMLRDAARYIPALAASEYVDSLWEVKTTLPASEHDDGRPILFRNNHGLHGLTCIMGGKIDNIYDVAQEIDLTMTGACP